jgi:hypothetical protein
MGQNTQNGTYLTIRIRTYITIRILKLRRTHNIIINMHNITIRKHNLQN